MVRGCRESGEGVACDDDAVINADNVVMGGWRFAALCGH
jgi:hypothetical protein